jgi:hypothetical protein
MTINFSKFETITPEEQALVWYWEESEQPWLKGSYEPTQEELQPYLDEAYAQLEQKSKE